MKQNETFIESMNRLYFSRLDNEERLYQLNKLEKERKEQYYRKIFNNDRR